MNIRVGYVMKTKVKDMEDKTRDGRTSRMRKKVCGMCPGCGREEFFS